LLEPDRRLRWDDPDLPVYSGGEYYSAERMHLWALASFFGRKHNYDYRNDPSYWWGEKQHGKTKEAQQTKRAGGAGSGMDVAAEPAVGAAAAAVAVSAGSDAGRSVHAPSSDADVPDAQASAPRRRRRRRESSIADSIGIEDLGGGDD
jgi:hypothetical protein